MLMNIGSMEIDGMRVAEFLKQQYFFLDATFLTVINMKESFSRKTFGDISASYHFFYLAKGSRHRKPWRIDRFIGCWLVVWVLNETTVLYKFTEVLILNFLEIVQFDG